MGHGMTTGDSLKKLVEGTTAGEDMELELKRRGEDCSNPAYLNAAAKRQIEVNMTVQQKP